MGNLLNLGIVGFGPHSLGFNTELNKDPILKGRVKVIAGFDPDPSAKERLKKFKSIKFVETFEELLDIKELEAIIIASPPQFHADQTVAALESNLHVFSEVPMAIREEDINKIINAENESGKVYQLGENSCFLPEVLFAAHLTSTGKIGKPH